MTFKPSSKLSPAKTVEILDAVWAGDSSMYPKADLDDLIMRGLLKLPFFGRKLLVTPDGQRFRLLN